MGLIKEYYFLLYSDCFMVARYSQKREKEIHNELQSNNLGVCLGRVFFDYRDLISLSLLRKSLVQTKAGKQINRRSVGAAGPLH